MIEVCLEVTDDNVNDLRCLGIECDTDDELLCQVSYIVNDADPSVGVVENVEVTGVNYQGHNVRDFFDYNDLREQVYEEYQNQCSLREESARGG